METAKLILTFIADIAWPAVAITIFLLLRHPIKELFAQITAIIFKKGNIELRLDIAKALEALGEPAEEEPCVIPLADLTAENLNWATFIREAINSQLLAILYLLSVPLKQAGRDTASLLRRIRDLEKISSFTKDHMSPDLLVTVQQTSVMIRRRFAHILETHPNPSAERI